MQNISMFRNIERCEMLAIRTFAAVWPVVRVLSGPNRAMQPRCAMRFESHTLKSLAMRIFFLFASDAKTHSLDLKSLENARNN